MFHNNMKIKNRVLQTSFFWMIILMTWMTVIIHGCSNSPPPEIGSLKFKLEISLKSRYSSTMAQTAARMNSRTICETISLIDATVTDANDHYLSGIASIPCSTKQASIDNILVGSNRKLIVSAEATDGTQYKGVKSGIAIIAGQTHDAGEITLYPVETDNGGTETPEEPVNTPPIATITAPENNSTFLSGVEITFQGNGADDEDDTLTGDALVWTSSLDGQIGTGISFSTNSLSLGDHIITLTVTDTNGAQGSSIINLSINMPGENTAPTATIKTPILNTSFTQGTEITFNGTGSDPEDGTLTGAALVWTSSIDGQLGTGATITNTTLSVGNHTITLTAQDLQGSQGTATIVISIIASQSNCYENGAVTIKSVTPANDTILTSGAEASFNVTYSYDFKTSVPDHIDVTLTAEKKYGTGETFAGLLDNTNNYTDNAPNQTGENTVTVRANLPAVGGETELGRIYLEVALFDSLNQNESCVTNGLFYETTQTTTNDPPVVSITDPLPGADFTSGEQIFFAGTVKDPEDGDITTSDLVWTSDRDGQMGTGVSLAISSLSVGSHTITLTATDSQGLKGDASINISIYAQINNPPVASISTPEDGSSYTSGTQINFSGSATDTEDSELSGSSLVWTSNLDGQLGTGANLSINSLSVGSHTITLTATDSEGLTGNASIDVTINAQTNSNPNVSISNPDSSTTYRQNTSVSFIASATDSEDGTLSESSVVWTSSIDGQIGTGDRLSYNGLSPGYHTLTVTATDSGSLTATDTVNIYVHTGNDNYRYILSWGSQGSRNGQFDYPQGMAQDTSGNIYVTEVVNNRVQKFDSDTKYLLGFGVQGSGKGQFINPAGIVVNSSNRIYVCDSGNNRIQEFDTDGNYAGEFGSRGSGDGQFSSPFGICVDTSNNIYVTDQNNLRVQKFDSNGNYLSQWGTGGSGDGQFSAPRFICADDLDNIYVADIENMNIQKFDNDGKFIGKMGSSGSGDGQFSGIGGIRVDTKGVVYVVDVGNNRVQKFDSNLTYLSQFGSQGSNNGSFDTPADIILKSNTIYVADSNNYRVQMFANTSFVLGSRRMWFAENVGLVKVEYQHNDGTTSSIELSSYNVPNGNSEYFPLQVNNSWSYTWSNGYHTSNVSETCEVTSMIDGIYTITCNGSSTQGSASGTFNFQKSATEITSSGKNTSGSIFEPLPMYMVYHYIAEPSTVLRLPPQMQNGWEETIYFDGYNYGLGTSVVMSDSDTVDVGAGSFTDVVRIDTTFTD